MSPNDGLLAELAPAAGALLERHLQTSREWFPHELIPYGRGRDAVPGQAWTPDDADLGGAELTDAVRSALHVNLLTEDNLPYYVREIDVVFGRGEAWGAWAQRWTAEEGRHSMAIYGYLMTTRAIDPVALERARMVQVSTAQVPQPDDARDALVYLTLQELATRVSHRNTGKLIGDPVGYDLMSRVASDENLHHLFYRDVTAAAIELDPSGMVQAIERQVSGFAMPGVGIPDFDRHAALIARAGIYDFAVHHDQILVPVVLRQWRVAELTGLDDAGEAARDRLLRQIERIGRLGRRLAERRESELQTATL
jgi:acyl-[acyl-carrier-protein] desaturase